MNDVVEQVNKRPDTLLRIGEKPKFWYVNNIEIGEPGEKDNIKIDALRLENLNAPASIYYKKLIDERCAKPGYEKTQALFFQNNSTVLIVAKDGNGNVSVYFTPSAEIDSVEQEHLNDLTSKGSIYQGGSGEFVPFSSSGSDSIENVSEYLNAITRFNTSSSGRKPFTKSKAA